MPKKKFFTSKICYAYLDVHLNSSGFVDCVRIYWEEITKMVSHLLHCSFLLSFFLFFLFFSFLSYFSFLSFFSFLFFFFLICRYQFLISLTYLSP